MKTVRIALTALAMLALGAPVYGQQFRMTCNNNVVTSFTFNNPAGTSITACSLTTDTGASVNYEASVSGGAWLTIQAFPSSASVPATSLTGTTTGQFLVYANPAGLATNTTYTGTITIRQTANPANTVNYPVTMVLGTGGSGTGGAVTFSTTSVTTTYTVGQSTPAAQPVTMTSAGAFSYTIGVTAGTFIQILNQTTGTSTSHSFQIGFNVAGLGAGVYNGNVQVAVPNQNPVNISVTLTVNSGTSVTGVSFSTTALTFNHAAGALSNPAGQSITMTSATAFNFAANFAVQTPAGGNWLSINPAFSSVAQNTQTFTVNVSPGSLGNGTYTGTISVFVNSQVQTISVTLIVGTGGSTGGGTGTLSKNTFNFTYANGVLSPNSDSFTIGFGVGASYTITTTQQINTATNQNVDFLRFSDPLGTVGATPIVVLVQGAQNLPVGTYRATANVVAAGQTATLTVNLTVQTAGGGGSTGSGGFTASPALLTFSYNPATPAQLPPSQTITLSSPSPNVTYSLSAAVNTGGFQWLGAGPSSGTTTQFTPSTASITVSVFNPAQLAIGSYTGQIVITVLPPGQAAQNITVPVTLVVGTGGSTGGTGGQSTLSPSQLTFTYQSGTAPPPAQVLAINTSGGAVSGFTAAASSTTGSNWLQVTPLGGNAPGSVGVSVNPLALAPGVYNGTVSVTLSGSVAASTVPVTLNVSGAALLRTNINQANFNYQPGGTVPIGQGQVVDVTSTGIAVAFSTSSTVTTPAGGTWLSVTPTSGTTPSQVTIGINATNLPAGTYTGTVFLTAQGQNAVAIPVTLNVGTLPLINTTPTALSFAAAVGASSILQQNITASTTNANTFVALTATNSVSSGSSWLSVVQTGNSVFTVTANPTGLTDGTYYGAVIISASSQGTTGNSPVIVPVVLVMGTGTGTGGGGGGGTGGGGTGAITLNPSTLSFVQIQGGGAPAAQPLNIGSTGGSLTLSIQTSTFSGGSWLTVSQQSAFTPAAIQVSVNAGALPIGSYSGSIIVSSTGGTNSPQVIPVTVNVVAPPTVTANPNSLSFTATTTGGAPASQSLSLTSSGANLSYSVTVTVGAGQPNWLEVTPTTGTTPATLTVRPNITNLQPGTYTATISVNLGLSAPLSIPVTLTYQSITPAQITAVTNAASFLPTAVSPGMIVSIFGSNLGPQTLSRLRLNSAGLVDTTLDGVRVLFDGIAAPMVYARNDVVSAVVPYALTGRATTNVQVEYQGVRSREVAVRVVDAAPGIFTTNQQGSGQGAILNSDFSLNGPTNPVARGSFATVYLTGEGQTAPGGVDGLISSASQLRRPVANVQVRIGGRPAEVIYAGSVPTTVLGLCQVSFFIPADAPVGGSTTLDVIIGGVASQTGVSIAVR